MKTKKYITPDTPEIEEARRMNRYWYRRLYYLMNKERWRTRGSRCSGPDMATLENKFNPLKSK